MKRRHKPSRLGGRESGSRLTRRALLQSGAGGAALAAVGAGWPTSPGMAQTATPSSAALAASPRAAEWPSYGRDPGGMRHSPLDQITRANVQHLAVAWSYHTCELATYEGTPFAEKAAFEATPLMVDGTL